MIGYIKGKIMWQDLKSVVVDVGGVGYKIYTTLGGLDVQKEVEFFTYLAVRETALDLYGFIKKEELDFFELLLTVSGIGPKSALAILSVASLDTLSHAINTNDASHLTKVSGIGKKNAEKIVLELKGKAPQVSSTHMINSDNDDAIEALKSLGYSERDSREALKKAEGSTTQEKIRSALKNLK
ncbi:MAG: Holliday junction branch migration protein RuvA [Minisyncoccota bacterium]